MSATYQTHSPDVPGMSDSLHKLKVIQLPSSLAGKRVLDIGCSEGFFCNEAAKRGAARVLGIDLLAKNTEFARRQYPDQRIEFRTQGWHSLPDEEFDIILWLSAMHYEKNPKAVLEQIRKRLTPGGTFILETGVFNVPGRATKVASRPGENLIYPTMQYLTEVLLDGFCPKWVAGGYSVKGDPVPRHVFHCTSVQQTIIFVRGASRSGKTFISRQIRCDKVLHVDDIILDILGSRHQHSPFEKMIKEHGYYNLAKLYRSIDESDEMSSAFAKWLAALIYTTDQTVVVEGDLQDMTVGKLKSELPGAVFWDTKRS